MKPIGPLCSESCSVRVSASASADWLFVSSTTMILFFLFLSLHSSTLLISVYPFLLQNYVYRLLITVSCLVALFLFKFSTVFSPALQCAIVSMSIVLLSAPLDVFFFYLFSLLVRVEMVLKIWRRSNVGDRMLSYTCIHLYVHSCIHALACLCFISR